jgi:hypothetical protein
VGIPYIITGQITVPIAADFIICKGT